MTTNVPSPDADQFTDPSSENYRLDVMSNDWWGEPLGAMLSRVLTEEHPVMAGRGWREDIPGFRMRGDRLIKLHAATRHAGPLPV